MKKSLYYINGAYQEEVAYKNTDAKKIRRRRRKRLLIWLCCIGCIALLLKCTVYTEQYFWTNELIAAIDEGDIKTVERLLRNDEMDVNREGGQPFPLYILPLGGEFSLSTPMEAALWHEMWYEETGIVTLLLDHGAKCVNDYYPEDVLEMTNFLVQYVGESERRLTDKSVLLEIVQWEPEFEAKIHDMKEAEVEQEITDIFTAVYGIMEVGVVTDKDLKKMLSAAETSGNETLVQFLQKELEKTNE